MFSYFQCYFFYFSPITQNLNIWWCKERIISRNPTKIKKNKKLREKFTQHRRNSFCLCNTKIEKKHQKSKIEKHWTWFKLREISYRRNTKFGNWTGQQIKLISQVNKKRLAQLIWKSYGSDRKSPKLRSHKNHITIIISTNFWDLFRLCPNTTLCSPSYRARSIT